MRIRNLMSVAAFAMLGGCATPQQTHLDKVNDLRLTHDVIGIVKDEGKVELAADERVVCRREMLTGSHMIRWRCATVAGTERDARADQDKFRETIMRPTPRIGQ